MRTKLSKTGYAGVYKNHSCNTYYYISRKTSDLNAKDRVFISGFKTPEEAYQAKQKREDEFRLQVELANSKGTISNLASRYLDWKRSVAKLSTAHHAAMIISKYLTRPYGMMQIEEFCKEKNFDSFRERIINHNISTGQKNKILQHIRDLFQYASLINFVTSSQLNLAIVKTIRIKEGKVEKNLDLENYWTWEEWLSFMKVIDKRDRWYVFFALYGQLGCRIGEIIGLQNKHFDPVKHTIRIEQQVQNNTGSGKPIVTNPKTKSSIRTVTISPKMSEMLFKFQSHYKDLRPDNFLFFNTQNPVGRTTIRRKFNNFTNKAKLRHITLHGIRHSNCTWLLSDELSVQEIGQVSKRLGHTNVAMTLEIYTHLLQKNDDELLNDLESNFIKCGQGVAKQK